MNAAPETESIGLLLRRVLSSVTQQASQALAPMGLTDAQWRPLLRLHFNDGLTVAELVRELQMDAGGATRMLDRLEAKGLCERTRSVTDRRTVHVWLTEKGREVAKGIPATVVQVMDRHLTGFRADERDLLKTFLQRMLENGTSE